MYVYGWVHLLSTWNYHNIASQQYFNIIVLKKENNSLSGYYTSVKTPLGAKHSTTNRGSKYDPDIFSIYKKIAVLFIQWFQSKKQMLTSEDNSY